MVLANPAHLYTLLKESTLGTAEFSTYNLSSCDVSGKQHTAMFCVSHCKTQNKNSRGGCVVI